MDPEISLVMSNFGLVSSSSFVFDPFVGTGSLLLAAAHHGAFVAGVDIDYKCVHGIGKSSRSVVAVVVKPAYTASENRPGLLLLLLLLLLNEKYV